MNGNCLGCLMRHMNIILSLTNDFSKVNCQHSPSYSEECPLTTSRGRKCLITTLQILIFVVGIYNLINILQNILQNFSSSVVVLDFFVDFITLIFLIEYNLQGKEILADTKDFLYISQCIESFNKNDFYFLKWYWLPYCILVPEMLLYCGYEITFLLCNEVNTMTLTKMFLNTVVGEWKLTDILTLT